MRAAATGPQRCDARGTVGYNYQFDRFVLGVEGDYSWGDITDSKRDGNYIIEDLKIDGFGTIRGRIGYAVGNFLPYVTGGVSFERMQLGQSCPDQASAPFGWCHTHGPYNLHDSQWNTGYVVGGGVEWKASERVSLKAEVLYTDFGTETYSSARWVTVRRWPQSKLMATRPSSVWAQTITSNSETTVSFLICLVWPANTTNSRPI